MIMIKFNSPFERCLS